MEQTNKEVLEEDRLYVRKLVLNRPRQLNALSYFMVSKLLERFLAYEKDPDVKLIMMQGKGRAFCAGGDVANVVRDIRGGSWRSGAGYFQKEFTLNYVLATYSKIQVSILNGIVMGGGAGASVHGRFRVATENTAFAMPETALGLFPDIGASFFLSRLPGFFGEYVGLTGARLDGPEMLACGLATHFVHSKNLPLLEEALCKATSYEPANISAVIDKYSDQPEVKRNSAFRRLDIIDRCFSHKAIEDIISSLEKESVKRKDDWASSVLQSLKKASPTSLKVSLRSIREGRLQGVGQCLAREYRMVCHFMRGEPSEDFFEGCRALLIDKDKNPRWKPSSLDQVSDEMVERYFSRVPEEGWEDLKLPVRSNVPAYAIAKL